MRQSLALDHAGEAAVKVVPSFRYTSFGELTLATAKLQIAINYLCLPILYQMT
ncbi:MAG: hypothetical protein CM15mP3_07010 [Candidatus Poseidoniales archaeon]|nr:MAG: hypothetical protein CM15mP3_07010 [Candidatus Poseidoniales archaeon]